MPNAGLEGAIPKGGQPGRCGVAVSKSVASVAWYKLTKNRRRSGIEALSSQSRIRSSTRLRTGEGATNRGLATNNGNRAAG